jgi:hypothetical protein
MELSLYQPDWRGHSPEQESKILQQKDIARLAYGSYCPIGIILLTTPDRKLVLYRSISASSDYVTQLMQVIVYYEPDWPKLNTKQQRHSYQNNKY